MMSIHHRIFAIKFLVLVTLAQPILARRASGRPFATNIESATKIEANKSASIIGTEWHVVIHWTRHGQSCANAIQDYGIGGKALKNGFKDPSLTSCGVQRSIEAGDKFQSWWAHQFEGDPPPAFDFVGSSTLLRATQTAVFQFGRILNPLTNSRSIYTLPYISEKNSFTLDNQASDTTIQDSVREAIARNTQTAGVDWNSVVNVDHTYSQSYEKDSNHVEKFYEFLAQNVLPSLAQHRMNSGNPDKELRLAIVSHSDFLKETFKGMCGLSEKPGNNDVLSVPYTFSVPGRGTSNRLVYATQESTGELSYTPKNVTMGVSYSCKPASSPVSMKNRISDFKLKKMPSNDEICVKDMDSCSQQVDTIRSGLSGWGKYKAYTLLATMSMALKSVNPSNSKCTCSSSSLSQTPTQKRHPIIVQPEKRTWEPFAPME